MTEKKYDLEDRLIDFVIQIDDIIEKLPNTRLGNYLAGQMIRSGTTTAKLRGPNPPMILFIS